MGNELHYQFKAPSDVKILGIRADEVPSGGVEDTAPCSLKAKGYVRPNDGFEDNSILKSLLQIQQDSEVPIKTPTFDGDALPVSISIANDDVESGTSELVFSGPGELHTVTYKEREGLYEATAKIVCYIPVRELPLVLCSLMGSEDALVLTVDNQ